MMNDLSWFLYFADITEKLGIFLSAIGIIGLIVFPTGALISAIDDYDESFAHFRKLSLRRGLPLSASALLLACLIPSSSTMYAIAASEMGEKALNSKTGGKAVEALNAWLDRQIEGKTNE